MSDRSGGGFWRVIAKLSQQRDQSTALMREEYLRLDEDDRRVFREWLEALASAGGFPVGVGANVRVQVHLDIQFDAKEPESVAVSPRTLAKAMAAWDRGEEYVHSVAEF